MLNTYRIILLILTCFNIRIICCLKASSGLFDVIISCLQFQQHSNTHKHNTTAVENKRHTLWLLFQPSLLRESQQRSHCRGHTAPKLISKAQASTVYKLPEGKKKEKSLEKVLYRCWSAYARSPTSSSLSTNLLLVVAHLFPNKCGRCQFTIAIYHISYLVLGLFTIAIYLMLAYALLVLGRQKDKNQLIITKQKSQPKCMNNETTTIFKKVLIIIACQLE